mmetsp:Transcript_14432/g.38079  ORF Transcript_14432/g.38079 Transcript_14432/m.38079 type:complete len:211 (+) Transcript_14432:80-712(+)
MLAVADGAASELHLHDVVEVVERQCAELALVGLLHVNALAAVGAHCRLPLLVLVLLQLSLVVGVEGKDHLLDLLFGQVLPEHGGNVMELVYIQQLVLLLVHLVEDGLDLVPTVTFLELLREQLVELLRRDLPVVVLVYGLHHPCERTGEEVVVDAEEGEHLLQLLHVDLPRVVGVDQLEHLVDVPLLLRQDVHAPSEPEGARPSEPAGQS